MERFPLKATVATNEILPNQRTQLINFSPTKCYPLVIISKLRKALLIEEYARAVTMVIILQSQASDAIH